VRRYGKSIRRSDGEKDRDKSKSAHEDWEPDRGNPRHGNEKKDIGISERERPADAGPKCGIVDDIPDGESPKENAARPLDFAEVRKATLRSMRMVAASRNTSR